MKPDQQKDHVLNDLENVKMRLNANIRREEKRLKRSLPAKLSLEHLKRAKRNTEMAIRRVRHSRSAEVLLAPIFFGLGTLVDYLIHMEDAKQEDVDRLFAITATHSIQISELQTATRETREQVNAITRYLPQLETAINELADNTQLLTEEIRLNNLFTSTLQALTVSYLSFVFALESAKQGHLTPLLLTDVESEVIEKHAKDKYHHDIITDRDAVKTKVIIKNGTIEIVYAFPIKDRDRDATLYKVEPLPIFRNNTRFTAVPETPFVAVMKIGEAFAFLTESEAATYLTDPHNCRVTSPIQTEVENVCGVSNWFHRDPNCPTMASRDLAPYFYTIGNKTVYSVNTEGVMHTHCSKDSDNHGTESSSTLRRNGVFFTKSGCYNTFNGLRILPSNEEEHSRAGSKILGDFNPTQLYTADIVQIPGTDQEFETHVLQSPLEKAPGRILKDNDFTQPEPENPIQGKLQSYAGVMSATALGLFGAFFTLVTIAYCCFRCKKRYLRDLTRDLATRATTTANFTKATPNGGRVNFAPDWDHSPLYDSADHLFEGDNPIIKSGRAKRESY